MASGFETDLSVSIDELPATLALMPDALDRAVFRALNRLAKWLALHSARETGQVLQIKQRALRPRFRAYFNREDKSAKVWIGLNKIQLHHFKKLKQSKNQVFVPGLDQTFDNAFISNKIGQSRRDGKQRVWVRDKSKDSGLKAAEADISKQALDSLQRWEQRTNARFNEILRQEVNNELREINPG
ncbi:hypothetical protein EYS14_03375 [Alteromonadaceae bacterium M269]|nr:hypothetical protein EYS14_03375 [Alteromonadaceae bacterium M269]